MALNEKTEKTLLERLEALPPNFTDLFTNGSIDSFIESIQKKHELSETQIAKVSNEIVLTLLILEPIVILAENIQQSAEIPNATASAIVEQLKVELLNPDQLTFLTNINAIQEKVPETSETINRELDLQPQSDIESDERFTTEKETKNQNTETQNEQQKPEPTEQVPSDPNNISPLRTMKDDAERAGASAQKENTKKPIVELPRYVQEENENT